SAAVSTVIATRAAGVFTTAYSYSRLPKPPSLPEEDGMPDNVQRFATRRQHERSSAMPRSTSSHSSTWPRATSAVYPGARVARGGANYIVIRRVGVQVLRPTPFQSTLQTL